MPRKAWTVTVVVALVIAFHLAVLYRLTSHLGWTVISGLVLLVLLKHVGAVGPIYAILKRRTRP